MSSFRVRTYTGDIRPFFVREGDGCRIAWERFPGECGGGALRLAAVTSVSDGGQAGEPGPCPGVAEGVVRLHHRLVGLACVWWKGRFP